jgi:hypothetical protein
MHKAAANLLRTAPFLELMSLQLLNLAGRSGDRIPVEARFSERVQTGPGAHSASCRMGTGSFPGEKAAGARG